jgi:inorganic pyrophosphatase
MTRLTLQILLAVFAPLALVSAADAQWVHPFAYPQTGQPSGEVWMVVEIPAGSMTKYEIDKTTGLLVVDRFQSMPVSYPANYGAIPSTYAGDGDNLDAVVLTREPLVPGALIRVRVIGMLPMVDGGDQDDKLIAVPASVVDPTYDEVRDITDLPAETRTRISAFFRVYRTLPAGGRTVELKPFEGRARALATLDAALAEYRQRRPAGKRD